jgi:Zn-dependent protease
MKEPMRWTVGLGRWRGVRIRVHVLLVAFAVSVLWWGMSDELGSQAYGPLCVAVLAVSILAREMARLWVARYWVARVQVEGRAGSEAAEIVLWPMGGWLMAEPIGERRGELAVALAAPLAGGVLMALGGAVLLVMASAGMMAGGVVSGGVGTLVSWLPPSPTILEGGGALWSVAATVATAAALLAWVNGTLLLINVLPVGSLDGAHVLRAVLRDDSDPRRQERLMARAAVAAAVALVALGWGVWDVQPGASAVLWLVAVAMCRRDRVDERSPSSVAGCVLGTVAVPHEAKLCRPGDAPADHCRGVGRVCRGHAVIHCAELPRPRVVGRYVRPVAGASSVDQPRLNHAGIRRRRWWS